MTERERFYRQMRPDPRGAVPNWEFGYWETTLPEWRRQGLPATVNSAAAACRYFGIESPHFGEGYFVWGGNLRLCPGLPPVHLGVQNGHDTRIDADGVTYAVMSEGQSSIPHYLDYTLKGRREWEAIFKPRLDPATAGRFPELDWEAIITEHTRTGKPIFLFLDSFVGYLRNLMGFETFAMLPYDDLELFEEMVETLTVLKEALLDRLSGKICFDMVHYWEDISYNAGPMMNPEVFRAIVVPRMQRVNARVREEFACPFISLDSDGNFLALLEPWLEAGVNCLMPCEVDAGMDINLLQARYGDRCTFHGAIQKKALIEGQDAIDAELRRVLPAVRRGGYIPHLDHCCPANVPMANYQYYLQQKRALLGCV